MNRQLCSIFLIFCLVAPVATINFCLRYQRRQIRREIKHQIMAGMDKEELVLLKFSQKETLTALRWKHSAEFEYHQQMYDIVERELREDSVYYWCWWDNKETLLNRQLNELFAHVLGNKPQEKNTRERLTHFFSSFFCENLSDWNIFSLRTGRIKTPCEVNYQALSFPPPVPPPEAV
ncbi:MAG: hypothetical protein R3B47_16505 [Bacteroidia bacterium]